MNENGNKPEQCKNKARKAAASFEAVPDVVKKLLASSARNADPRDSGPIPAPSQAAVAWIIDHTRQLLFPGYFSEITQVPVHMEYRLGQELMDVSEALACQIILALQHDCFRYDLDCFNCEHLGREAAQQFIQALPHLRETLTDDVQAAMDGDPAAQTHDEVIFSYPGLFAITVYRMAHTLHELKIPLLPRMMTEYAHRLTGVDIHPGATIGCHFFIDHGTGVVIGETTVIGDRVRLYQGVTLGGLSLPFGSIQNLRGKKRHPTVEDDVTIYSNTTILGGETIIGARSVIGGNIWLTESVPPDTKVLLKKPELIYIDKTNPQSLDDDS